MAGAKEEPEPVNEENVTWPPALKDDEADGISEKPTGCSVADSTIDDLAKFLPADISLDLPMQPTTWEQYQVGLPWLPYLLPFYSDIYDMP